MNSLQSRLIAGVVLVFALGFVLAALAIFASLKASMYTEFDEALFATAQALASLTEETRDGVELEIGEGFEEFSRPALPSYYQFWLDGTPLTRSAYLQGDLEFGQGSRERPKYQATTLPDGRPGRQICMTFHPALEDGNDDADDADWFGKDSQSTFRLDEISGSSTQPSASLSRSISPEDSGIMTLTWERPKRNVTVAVARATTEIDRRLSSLLWILPGVGLAITLLSSAVLTFVVRSELRPVQTVAHAITAIDEHSLGDRVPTARVPVEISPMVRRLNDLLSRLEDAFHREREFSSNLAHELRTPLAGLRATLEVHRSRGHQPERCDQMINTCLEICHQSETLVEHLLTLARVESSPSDCQAEIVPISELIEECWRPIAEEASRKQLTTSFDVPEDSLRTDRDMLRVILRNLLSNAVSHGNEGGSIQVAVSSTVNQFRILVSNTGNQISAEQAPRAFDRLWRGDAARGQTGEHFGLGLTIVKRLTEALGGSVALTVGESFQISITLPR